MRAEPATSTQLPIADESILASSAVRERLLLSVAGLFVLTAHLVLLGARPERLPLLIGAGIWVICASVGHVVLSWRLPNRDPFLFPITMLLSGWGLEMIARLEPFFAMRQIGWLVVSAAVLCALAYAPRNLRWLSHYRYLWLFGGLLLLALTIVLGSNPSGAGPRLWLGIADVYFQPSESLKIILVVFLASYIAEKQGMPHSSLSFLLPLLFMWGFCIVILLWQQDLGTATLFFLLFVTILYIASGNLIYVVGSFAMLALAGLFAYWRFPVVRLRIDIWLNPWPEASDRAYQIVQSLFAFAAGGILGQGAGQGSPSYIPVVHSDFVFAALAEEWGLLGALIVVACIVVLVIRGLRLALRLQDRPFRALLAAGLSALLGIQSLMIIGGTLKLIPLTGVTLPLLSYGGSSLLMSFVAVGLLLVLSEDARP
ncbi:MAG: FtsW/RodA/SpoVE family cell cycle protein [Anaerolineae bacterium]|nr:FtsW/RodA/SpoVE family cell cycle protein [Anaerolineae bacterium]